MVRQYRNDAGLCLADTAGFLNCDLSKMSRIESGERGFAPVELRKVLRSINDALIPYTTATYHNWTSRHIEPRPYRHYGEHLPRLVELKRAYDPEHVFVVDGGLPLIISEPDAEEWGLPPTIIEGLRANGSLGGCA
jgi:Berberine and berberine like